MKKHLHKYKPLFLTIIGYGALGSVLVVGDQIRRIYIKINKATSTDVLSISRYQPTYIYIEDPFVQEEITAGFSLSKERLKLTRFHKWFYNKIEESFIFRNWYSYKKNLPWRFLRLAKDESQNYRLRAVRSLASMTNLTDSDYQQLAQACDKRTSIGLARTADTEKFFLDPPYFKTKPNHKAIVKNFHDFFIALNAEAKHPCLQYFVSKVIGDLSEAENKVFDDELRPTFESTDFIPTCLDALLHHSWIENSAKQIIKLGGLPLLVEVYKLIKENEAKYFDSLMVLSKLLSSLSIVSDSSESFFKSGCIKILYNLSRHKDVRVAAPAHRALSNFDEDDPPQTKNLKYLRRLYPLYPTRRTLSQPKLDVIFIHGLLGGIFITWRQRDYGNCSHKSPLELLATVGKLFDFKITNRLALAPHLSVPKKVPSFPIPESGLTVYEEERDQMAYQTSKPLDQDFIVDVSDLNREKIAEGYEIVLSDIPIDSNALCCGPFYGSTNEISLESDSFTKCWPKDWLAEDCPEIKLIGVNYETNISQWTPMCPVSPPNGTLMDRSQHLMHILSRAGVGKRPIVWIGHSMGGLLVKGVLSLSRNSSDPKLRSLFEQTKGIVFYSTPHKGSHLAAFNPTSQMILWPSTEVQELRENSPGLLKLHEEFLDLVKENPIRVISFAERESTYITSLKFEIRFVNSQSANPDFGEHYGIPLDHLSICKPSGRQSFLYQKVKKLIQEIISEIEVKKT